ncbi:MAG: NAD-dependent epimerase/dehydratase family protein [Gemmatimonadota bacterium]|nr:NAD-dependent epimerase/dehydratase family protein [Gemmatimonadota bacterium]
MRVFLTGGTGLLGSHLAHELRKHECEVVALHRRDSKTLFLEENECDLVQGDVRDDVAVLATMMKGCSHVVHGAALVYAGGSWPQVRAVNVDGTRNVLTAAHVAGVQHAVHLSSVAVYGDSPGPADETKLTDSDLPPEDLYARSKREAEKVAREIEEQRNFPVTIIRPSAVYGERDRLMGPALVDILRLPLVPIFGPGKNALPVVYAGNVAVATRLAVEAAQVSKTYNVGLDHALTQRELFEYLGAGFGIDPRFVTIPGPLVKSGGGVLARLGVKTPGAKHLPINRLTKLVLSENPYPSGLIRDELGWSPAYEHRPALERTGRWLAQHPMTH